MGGGARPPEADEDTGPPPPRLGAGPRARWAELGAGNWPRDGTRPGERGDNFGGGGGGIIMEAGALGGTAPVELSSSSSAASEKLGTGRGEGAAVALGVVGDSGSDPGS